MRKEVISENRPKVISVIITHNPDISILESTISCLRSQTTEILIVDNNSQKNIPTCLIETYTGNVKIISLPENIGLAGALNIGINEAEVSNMEYILFLDQDSYPEPDLVRSLLDTYLRQKSKGTNIAAVGSRYRDRENLSLSEPVRYSWFRLSPISCAHQDFVYVDILITSGSLIGMEELRIIGPMREDLFIDYVDIEWILRAKNKGYNAVCDCRAVITHSIGEYRKTVWLGRWRHNVPFHKPFRYYYIMRNFLLLFQQKNITSKWKVMELQRVIKIIITILLYSKKRHQVFQYLALGFLDGIRKRSGQISWKIDN